MVGALFVLLEEWRVNELSLIKSVELENFMSIEHGKIEFDDTNIICLCGYNDSGKSAVTEAIEILFYDSYSRNQAAYIQDGKDFFKVTMTFDDGVEVSKTKLRNGNGIWELKQGGTTIYTNQLNDAVASVDKVPEPIYNYLGVVYDEYTQSLLNVRRNRDKLLLVDTSGGDNYKIFNSILKSDLLAETSKRLNTDKNKLSTECNNRSNSLNTLKDEIDCMNCATVESLDELSEEIHKVTELSEKYESLVTILELSNTVESYVDWGELEVIDTERLNALESLKRIVEVLQEPLFEECETIDIERMRLLEVVKQESETLRGIEILPEISTKGIENLQERLREFESLRLAMQQLESQEQGINEIDEQQEGVKLKLAEYAEKYDFKVCPTCGTVVI